MAAAAPPPACLQLGSLGWLRLREYLVRLALQQGQLAAAEEQLELGVTEARVANDTRIKRALHRLRLHILVGRGEAAAAADT